MARYPVAWDAEVGPGTFVVTCRSLFSDLRLMLPHLPDGSVWRALGFSALVGLFAAVTMTIADAATGATTSFDGELLLGLAVLSSGYIAWIVGTGASFYLGQRTLGGDASITVCMRASAYLTGLGVLPLFGLVMPLFIAAAIVIASSTLWLWGWTLFGSGSAGLSSGRAVASTCLALVGGATSAFLVMSAVVGLALAITGEL